ncbi:MAG: hypothetical protein ACFFD4_01330 [Candidatus Odinarchaeota archaeon]
MTTEKTGKGWRDLIPSMELKNEYLCMMAGVVLIFLGILALFPLKPIEQEILDLLGENQLIYGLFFVGVGNVLLGIGILKLLIDYIKAKRLKPAKN